MLRAKKRNIDLFYSQVPADSFPRQFVGQIVLKSIGVSYIALFLLHERSLLIMQLVDIGLIS